jgi:hypothetical protein
MGVSDGPHVLEHRTHVVKPEVAGRFGPNTDLDPSVHPPRVHRLHYVFEGWLGDDLVESFPCFLATERLAEGIDAARLTGVTWASVEVEKSEQMEIFYPDIVLPAWRWMRLGDDARDDLWADATAVLHVSERALRVIRQFHIEAALIAIYAG